MKIVDAIWEKRNLGVDTIEIQAEDNDTRQEIIKTLSEINADYAVVKIPTQMTDILFDMNRLGFVYAEDMLHFVHFLSEQPMNPVEKRFYEAIHVEIMNDNDFTCLLDEINNNMFSTDRISCDSFFGIKAAAKRYSLWMCDERKNGTLFYKYVYKNSTIGFFTLRETKKGCYTSALGGIYSEFRSAGLGKIVKVPQTVRELNGHKLLTSVSSNNPTQIKSMISNGYSLEKIYHIYVKHNVKEAN